MSSDQTDFPTRRGACCVVDQDNGLAYVFRGYQDVVATRYEQCISVYDYKTQEWNDRYFTLDSVTPDFSIGACCTILDNKKLILFSGWHKGYLSNQIYELDLATLKWVELKPVTRANEPMMKNKGNMVSYGKEMVYIFGGYGYTLYNQQLQKNSEFKSDRPDFFQGEIGWTNEQHLFHVANKQWIVPETTGLRPPPCAGFSLNKIDPATKLFKKIERNVCAFKRLDELGYQGFAFSIHGDDTQLVYSGPIGHCFSPPLISYLRAVIIAANPPPLLPHSGAHMVPVLNQTHVTPQSSRQLYMYDANPSRIQQRTAIYELSEADSVDENGDQDENEYETMDIRFRNNKAVHVVVTQDPNYIDNGGVISD